MLRFVLLLACLAAPASAQPMLEALRAQNWQAAETLAAAGTDPLGVKLVTFIRLLNPGQGSASEVLAFMTANPSWPDQPALEHRFAEALETEPDGRTVADLCHRHPPSAGVALLRCAEAYDLAGHPKAAIEVARLAWVSGGVIQADQETEFLGRWGGFVTAEDQQRRFEHLETTDMAAARRQVARVSADFKGLAAARLAFRREDKDSLAYLPSVPQAQRSDPVLLLAEARFLRRSHADLAALDLWRTAVPQAEAAVPKERRAPFWIERDALARNLLAANDPDSAYFLANDALLEPDQALEADFLSGWILLRRLHDPARARPHFQAMADGARAALTQARAFYWLARAAPDEATARVAYGKAAAWPLTYYGQKAALAGGESQAALLARIVGLRDPAPNAGLAGSEMARAAALLASWGDKRRAADFLLRLDQPPAGLADRAFVAQAALREGLADIAVQTARLVGRDGAMLPQSGWPVAEQPPAGVVDPWLTLGAMRQESSFDPLVTSAAGAHGLMQLMPQTAQQVAHTIRQPAGPLTDPAVNMQLGVAYLGALIAQFGGTIPYAVAAYNAGPHRVHDWIAANGDAPEGDAMIDWIELIPFNETRNYVQRVLENAVVYQAKSIAH